jgi:hypothetical protein
MYVSHFGGFMILTRSHVVGITNDNMCTNASNNGGYAPSIWWQPSMFSLSF